MLNQPTWGDFLQISPKTYGEKRNVVGNWWGFWGCSWALAPQCPSIDADAAARFGICIWTWRKSFKITWGVFNKPRWVLNHHFAIAELLAMPGHRSLALVHALSDSLRMVKEYVPGPGLDILISCSYIPNDSPQPNNWKNEVLLHWNFQSHSLLSPFSRDMSWIQARTGKAKDTRCFNCREVAVVWCYISCIGRHTHVRW